jgi:hypothetical protein
MSALNMNTPSTRPCRTTGFELRFESLFHPGRGLVFPCDQGGSVELDELTDAARENYFYARAVVGREFALPAVVGGILP